MPKSTAIIIIENGQKSESVFRQRNLLLQQRGGMFLTEQISAKNLRLRTSKPGYSSDWHVAGDPTLIIIQQGTLKISLRNKETKTFSTGDLFVAADYLPAGETFDDHVHGHRAEVLGDTELVATHVKLSNDFLNRKY